MGDKQLALFITATTWVIGAGFAAWLFLRQPGAAHYLGVMWAVFAAGCAMVDAFVLIEVARGRRV